MKIGFFLSFCQISSLSIRGGEMAITEKIIFAETIIGILLRPKPAFEFSRAFLMPRTSQFSGESSLYGRSAQIQALAAGNLQSYSIGQFPTL